MWDAWGGTSMIEWASNKLKEIDSQEFLMFENYGGEGSGCQGDNCGRPKGDGSDIKYTNNVKENVDLTIEYGKKNGISIERSDKIPKNMVAMGSPSSQKIFINEKHPYWKNPIENQKKSFESGILSSPNPIHVIHHETSHLKHKNIRQTWLNKEYQQKVAGKVGGYAKTNPSEFVAETYAGMKSGIKYDEDVMNLYKIVGGKRDDFSNQVNDYEKNINTKINFTIQDEDQQIISGPLMLADTPIYRNDHNGEYYVVFTKETIKKIAQRYFKKGYQANVNLMHDSGQSVEGVTMFESFISDKVRGIYPMKGFEDVPDGSWFGSFKVDNPEVWKEIKAGNVRGFSVEGQFNYKKTGDKKIEQLWENVLEVLSKVK